MVGAGQVRLKYGEVRSQTLGEVRSGLWSCQHDGRQLETVDAGSMRRSEQAMDRDGWATSSRACWVQGISV